MYATATARPCHNMESVRAIAAPKPAKAFNVSCKRRGGIWFLRLGRLAFTFTVTR